MTKGPPFHRHVFEHLREAGEDLPGAQAVGHGALALERRLKRGVDLVTENIGGRARTRVVLLLAAILGLASADTGAVAALAPDLERSLHIGNLEIGLLVTVSALTAAVGTLPVGWVTDRWNRVRLVKLAVLLWAAAEIISALSPSYSFLLVIRLVLGALTAVTGPTLASLTGDFFPARERSRVFGYILTGQLIGAGVGLFIAALISTWFSWRVAFGVLAIPSLILWWEVHTTLPEPARGGQSRLERGAERIVGADTFPVAADSGTPGSPKSPGEPGFARADAGDKQGGTPKKDDELNEEIRRRHLDPTRGVVLDRDPLSLGWWESVRYVIAVRSNVTLILASALGYFFLTGVETFAFVYIEDHYGVSHALGTLVAVAIGLAAISGAVFGGKLTDWLLHRGMIDARLVVPGVAFLLTALAFAPGIITGAIYIALPLLLVAGFAISATNPGLDSARLDVVPSRMWGRAESVRSLFSSSFQAFAPLLFGALSTLFGGTSHGFATSSVSQATNSRITGLEPTFLIMLVTLPIATVIVWKGRRPYPTDVAAAAETESRYPATPSDVGKGTPAPSKS